MKLRFFALALMILGLVKLGDFSAAPTTTRAEVAPSNTALSTSTAPTPTATFICTVTPTGSAGATLAQQQSLYLPIVLRDGLSELSPTPDTTQLPGNETPTLTSTTGPGEAPTASATSGTPPDPSNTPTPSATSGPPPTVTTLFSWQNVGTTSPDKLSESQGGEINGKLYVFGGFYNSALQATTASHVYDPATATWKPIADLPTKLTHAPPAIDGNFFYFVGGFVGDNPGNSTTDVWRYDTANNTWHKMPALPEPIGAGAAVIVGRNLHFFGGTDRENGVYHDKSAHYVLALDGGTSWQSLAAMPNPRNHIGGTALDGKIYAVGGQKSYKEGTDNQTEVDVYDPTTNTWSRAADMPEPRGHTTSSLIANQGRIVMIGGSTNNGNFGRSSPDVLVYDALTDTWSRLPALPAGRKASIAGLIGNQIFVASGSNQQPILAGKFEQTWEQWPAMPTALGEVAGGIIGNQLYLVGAGSNATLAYDLSTATWRDTQAQRPFTGNHHTAEVYGGKLYLLGGLGSGGSAGKVQIYNPTTNNWTVGADMPFSAGSSASAVIGNKIYVAGGIVGSATTNQAAVYDPATNVWTSLAPMPQARNHAATASDGNKLYVFGGRGPGSGDSNNVANGFDTVQIYDPASNTWVSSLDAGSPLAPLPQGRGGMGKAVFFNGEFYIMGGETLDGPGATNKNVYARVDIYNPSTNTWRYGTPMPTARHGIFPLLHAGRIYVAGGGIQAGQSNAAVLEVYNP